VVQLPDPKDLTAGASIHDTKGGLAALDRAQMILWGSFCGVHTVFRPDHVAYWKRHGWRVLVHPESPLDTVLAADGSGSTDYLWRAVMEAQPGDKIAIGTEGHFVRNARQQAAARGVAIVHLTEIPEPGYPAAGCGCATMARNDPPHLAGMLDLLLQGRAPESNRVLPGDVVNEVTGSRERLTAQEQQDIVAHARTSLERMIAIVESA
jgi:quinolinate synthase